MSRPGSLLRTARQIPLLAAVCLLLPWFSACDSGNRGVQDDSSLPRREPDGPLVVFTAGSLARPMRAALDSFAATTGTSFELEAAGSLETARKLTELGKIPDIIALADEEVFPLLLIPVQTTWFARFARNRMVLAHTATARHAAEIDSSNWRAIVLRPGVEMGRADPDLDPAGYRTLMLFQLAELHYGDRGLASRLQRAIPRRNIRPKGADLIALAQAGEFDYIWEYESVSRAAGLKFVALPAAIDLSTVAESASYARAEVRVLGKSRGDTIVLRGRDISYGLSQPTQAPHPELATRFLAYLLAGDGRRVMRTAYLDALEHPEFSGDGVPAALRTRAAP